MSKKNVNSEMEIADIAYEIGKSKSVEDIENFFGLKITAVNKKENLYNVYYKGELLYANVYSWGIESIMEYAVGHMMETMTDKAKKEKALKRTNKIAEAKSKAEEQYKKDNYVYCPICGMSYERGTHIHT